MIQGLTVVRLVRRCEYIIGMGGGQVGPNDPKVMVYVPGMLKYLMIDLLQDIFDVALLIFEYPGRVDEPRAKRNTVPIQWV